MVYTNPLEGSVYVELHAGVGTWLADVAMALTLFVAPMLALETLVAPCDDGACISGEDVDEMEE